MVRHDFGFYSPNTAAGLIVTVLPLIWVCLLRQGSKRLHRKLLISVEVCLWGALFMTGSRGGAVAALFQLSVFHSIIYATPGLRTLRGNTPKRAVAAVMLFLALLALRSPTVIDSSVLNRAGYYTSAFRAAAAVPFSGVGFEGLDDCATMNLSGEAVARGVRGFGNGVLNLIIAKGFYAEAVLSIVIFTVSVCLVRFLQTGTADTLSCYALVAALTASGYGVANFFSTLWIDFRASFLAVFSILACVLLAIYSISVSVIRRHSFAFGRRSIRLLKTVMLAQILSFFVYKLILGVSCRPGQLYISGDGAVVLGEDTGVVFINPLLPQYERKYILDSAVRAGFRGKVRIMTDPVSIDCEAVIVGADEGFDFLPARNRVPVPDYLNYSLGRKDGYLAEMLKKI